jgi:signal transduction histidine kinase/L-rhamnose mutarotase
MVALSVLGVGSIALTGWLASMSAAQALRQANEERLTAIRETKRRQVETYFRDVRNHVLALSNDEATISALEQYRGAWEKLPELRSGSPREQELRRFYEEQVAFRVAAERDGQNLLRDWYPADARQRWLQWQFLAGNPHPVGKKDLLLSPGEASEYGRLHAQHHPTMHRYQSAFGFYDIFLIGPERGRILYTVFKEIDLGARLDVGVYAATGLGRAWKRAMAMTEPEKTVLEDYEAYMPSFLAPAAFVAAPVWRAGIKIGVLAIQVPIAEVNRVLTGDYHWEAEGMGATGQAYLAGADGRLRSDTRPEIENAERFFVRLAGQGVARDVLERARRNGTGILTLPAPEGLTSASGAAVVAGRSLAGADVLRSYAPVEVAEVKWVLVAEMDTEEALRGVRDLRKGILLAGLAVGLVCMGVAWWMARAVTRPVAALAAGARRLGAGELGVTVTASREDELGELTAAFNAMSENLRRTTVSRDELERLAELLMRTQEEERGRLARELHDDVTQRLAAVAIEAGRLRKLGASEEARAGLERIQREMARLSEDIHRMSRRLHPSILAELGLAAAVESECRGFFERGGPPVDLTVEGDLGGVEQETALGLYRITQEALNNVLRHARAESVGVSLQREGGEVVLTINDDGAGFARGGEGFRAGLGLASMAELAREFGGSITIESAPGRGTRIGVRAPAHREDGDG